MPNKSNVFQHFESANDFRSFNLIEGIIEVAYSLYVFEMGDQKVYKAPQPWKVEFNFSAAVAAGVFGLH